MEKKTNSKLEYTMNKPDRMHMERKEPKYG